MPLPRAFVCSLKTVVFFACAACFCLNDVGEVDACSDSRCSWRICLYAFIVGCLFYAIMMTVFLGMPSPAITGYFFFLVAVGCCLRGVASRAARAVHRETRQYYAHEIYRNAKDELSPVEIEVRWASCLEK